MVTCILLYEQVIHYLQINLCKNPRILSAQECFKLLSDLIPFAL